MRKAFDGAAHVVRLDLVNNRLIGAAIEPRAVLADGSATGKLTLYCADPGAASHPPRRQRAARPAADRDPLGCARCRRRLRLQGQALSRGNHRRLGGTATAAAGEMGRDAQRMLRVRQPGPRSPDPRRAGARRRGAFSRAARRYRRQSRRLCLDLRRRHPERDLQRAARRRLSHAGHLRCNPSACSPIRCRPTHIAAPAGPRPATCWSVLPTKRRTCSGSTGRKSGGAISIAAEAMPYKTPIGPTYDCGNFPKMLSRALEIADYEGFAKRRELRHARRGCAASASPVMWNPRAWRRRGSRRRWARESASSRRPRSACNRTAACRRCSAPTITAKATPRPSPKSFRRGSAFRCPRSRSSKATPIRCRMDPARSAHARSPSAAPPSIVRQ